VHSWAYVGSWPGALEELQILILRRGNHEHLGS